MSREWSAGTIRRAVMTVAQANPDVAFGLSMFPTGLGCSIGDGSGTGIFGSGPGVDWPHVPVRADGGASLEAWLASEDGSGGATPLISTIEWFADNAELVFGPDRSNSYLVVLTEGADTCRCQDDRDRLRCLTSNLTSATERAVAAGLKVVVIGYRYSEEPEALDAIAENGGTAFTTPLLAGSEATLSDVFGEVITDLKECLQ